MLDDVIFLRSNKTGDFLLYSQDDRVERVRYFSVFAAIILISLTLKIIFEGKLSFWLDEGYTAWFANLSFYDIWFWLPEIESHPPLYYTLVKLWGLFEEDSTALWHRSLSIFISILLVFSSYLSTRNVARYLKRDQNGPALFNSILICFSPVIFWYSIEARPYILLFLAYSIAILGVISIFSNGKEIPLKSCALFVFGAILTNWSHHLGGLFTAALFLSLIAHWAIDRKFERRFLYTLLICTMIIVAFSFPLIIQILHQIAYWEASSWVSEPTITSFIQIMRRVFGFGFADKYMDTAFGEYSLIQTGRLALGLCIGAISFVIMLYGLMKLVHDKSVSLACFFLLSCFAVPVISVLASFFGPNIFLERTLLPGLIPYFMILSISIEYINKAALRNAIKGLYIVVLALGLFATIREGEKEPWKEIMAQLSAQIENNDIILMMPNDLYLPASLYIEDPDLAAQIESVPAKYPAVTASDFYPDGFPAVPGIRPEDAATIKSLFEGKERVYLITRQEDLFDPNGITRKILDEQYNLASEEVWNNIHLDRFDRK